jgi:hypothetical protein
MVCPSFLVLFVFLQLDLVTTAITPWVVVVIAYLLSRHRLARGEALSSSAGGALNCHHNRQNWIVWFTKPEDPFFLFQSGASSSCPIRVQIVSNLKGLRGDA